MILLLSVLALFTHNAWSQTRDLCDLLDLTNCSGVSRQGRRSSLQSLPSPGTSAILNPATVSFDRGLGLEAIYQEGNPVNFGLASGNGKIGGAFISTSLENTFFGNRVFELEDEFIKRNEDKKQYRHNKLNLALAGKLLRKKYLALDAGVILKRHNEIKKINPGVGISGKMGYFTFGASYYQDDFHLKLAGADAVSFGDQEYSEKFLVSTYSLGVRVSNLTLDTGVIKTRYDRDEKNTEILLYSASYIYKNLMFNIAHRVESSPMAKFQNEKITYKNTVSENYAGVQVSMGKYLIMGLNYNYYLLREPSLMATLYL